MSDVQVDKSPSFTPAPWFAEMHGNNVLACDQQMMICNVRGWGYLTGTGGLNLPDDEAIKIQDANTRLIAAAPDLYAALKLWIEEARFWPPDSIEYDMAWQQAVKAIEAVEKPA